MLPKIVKKIQWDEVLENVSHNHSSDSIEFDMKSINSLLMYIEDLKSRLDTKNIVNEQLHEKNNLLKTKILAEVLNDRPQSISNFTNQK